MTYCLSFARLQELDLITRAAKGVPERARERAKDPAFQAVAYASATQKQASSWTAPKSQHLTAQQAEEARFLEELRLDVDRRIAAAAALSTGMNVGAKRRKVGEPTRPFQEMTDNLEVGSGEPEREGDKPSERRVVGKENRAFPQQAGVKAPERTVRRAGSRGAQRRDEKPVMLKKVEIAFGHKVDPPSGVQGKQQQVRKRKESETAGWVKRMSEPRRAPESPGGESLEESDRKRGAPPGVPRRSTQRPAEMMHRPANAVRWPSPEPRRPNVGQASGPSRPRAMGVEDFGGFEGETSPLGRLTALAREAAAGVNYQDLLAGLNEEHPVAGLEDDGKVDVDKAEEAPELPAAARETDRVPIGSAQLELTARELTDWLSEQVLSQLLQQPNILNGLRSSPSEKSSERNDGAVAGKHGPRVTPVDGASDDVSIDEELVRALAAEVISEEVERMWPQNGKGETAVQAGIEEKQAPVAVERKEQVDLVSEPKGTAQQEAEQSGEAWGRQESGLDVPVAGRAVSTALPSSAERETKDSAGGNPIGPPSISQTNSAKEAEPLKPSYSAAQPTGLSAVPGVSQLPSPPLAFGGHGVNPIPGVAQPFPFFPGANTAAGLQSMFGPNQPWPFIPFPFYYHPDGRVFPGAQFPNPPNPVPENLPQKQRAHAQTEPQTALRPIAVKPIPRKRGGESPATPPTPSTPSSSPEVTLVSRRRARRGFEAALEGMGISVTIAAEVEPEIRPTRPGELGGGEEATGVAREDDAGELEEGEIVERGSASSHSSEVQAGRSGLNRETANEQDEAVKEAEAAEEGKSVSPRGQDDGDIQGGLPNEPAVADPGDIAAGQPEEGSSEQPLPPDHVGATSAPRAEQSPGSRIRRKWAFLDERWDARQAIDGMTRSLLMEAGEESSSRSGGGTSGRGRTSASESTSVSFGEVVAGDSEAGPDVLVLSGYCAGRRGCPPQFAHFARDRFWKLSKTAPFPIWLGNLFKENRAH
jgi:hypothetical protein